MRSHYRSFPLVALGLSLSFPGCGDQAPPQATSTPTAAASSEPSATTSGQITDIALDGKTHIVNANGWTGTITPVGPTAAQLRDARTRLQAALDKKISAPFKIYSIQPLADKGKDNALIRFRAHVLDADERAFFVSGRLDQMTDLDVVETAEQPFPDKEERDRAVESIRQDPRLGKLLEGGAVTPYVPMPPFEMRDGRRHLYVGLERQAGAPTAEDALANEIVGVRMRDRRVTRFDGGAPPGSIGKNRKLFPLSTVPNCSPSNLPSNGQDGNSVPRGTQGSYSFDLKLNNKSWAFTVNRPSASFGNSGSGIELLNVYYQGVKLLARLSTPIVNVKYDGDACGPFRDWENEEAEFKSQGIDLASGIRYSNGGGVTTILDNYKDDGTYQGVHAVFLSDRIEITSELQAGWYRYVNRYVVHDNGKIESRWGFADVSTGYSCVCNTHYHNVFWIADFDVDGVSNQVYKKVATSAATKVSAEAKFLFPNANFGTNTDTYIARGASGKEARITKWQGNAFNASRQDYEGADYWWVHYNSSELDGGSPSSHVGLQNFVNGQSLDNEDVVFWYGGHWSHTQQYKTPSSAQWIGFDIQPSWQ